ncbi:hypothetical protein C1H46_004060 [Malus baccata]|uniref:Uncharacterized protein n=1 Tax=Malus baccata TaxID=106549 RepID=A0A540NH24_MALBA|nr:hypothetical protein C1H46_004060 [Malus baccata]
MGLLISIDLTFPLYAGNYSDIFGIPWISLYFKLLFGLGIRRFQSKKWVRSQKLSPFLLPCFLDLAIFVCSSLCGSKSSPLCRCPGQRYLFDWLLDKTILQPRVSRRKLSIHGSKGESLYF